MAPLTRDQILQADDLPTREVDVPEWGGAVLVRALSGTDRNEYESSMTTERNGEIIPDMANSTAKLVARVIIDPATGERIFASKDVRALGKKSAAALERVAKAAQELSGMTDAAAAVIEGNSAAGQPGASTSSEPTQPESQ